MSEYVKLPKEYDFENDLHLVYFCINSLCELEFSCTYIILNNLPYV